MTRKVIKYIKSSRKVHFHVMDAGDLGSTQALIRAGIDQNICAFTYCKYDWRAMNQNKSFASQVRKRCVDALDLYSEPIFHSGDHVVIDDGMQYACSTIPRIEKLLKSGPKTLAIMFNIVPRDPQKSHQTFIEDVSDIAYKYNYNVLKAKKLDGYNQCWGQTMWPFWFELVKK